MCLIVFAWQVHRAAPFLLAANRDEFHARPTKSADFWAHEPAILAGQDLLAGGTWLGLTPNGRFAAITNVRNPQVDTSGTLRSRGELPLEFLASDMPPLQYLETLAPRCGDYQGFNLLVGDGDSLCYLHAGHHLPALPTQLAPGVYGLSNAALGMPWAKVSKARDRLDTVLRAAGELTPDHDALQQCLADRSLAKAHGEELAGLDTEIAEQLTAQFIVTPDYGTRCCTTLRRHSDGGWDFREIRFDQQGRETGQDHFARRPEGQMPLL